MSAYNDHIEELRRLYGEEHAVLRLFTGEKGSLVVTWCAWPMWYPFVMPRCEIVGVADRSVKDGKHVAGPSLGSVRQALVFRILGAAVRMVDDPVEHFVCDRHVEGPDQAAIRNLLVPTIEEALTGIQGLEAI